MNPTPNAPATKPARNLIPIVCDLTGAPDTPAERINAYRQLFTDALVTRDRTVDGIRFRFRANTGIEDRIRELARLETECCAFFMFTINLAGGEVLLDVTVIDDDIARNVLDEFYRLPDTINADNLSADTHTLQDRFTNSGLTFAVDPSNCSTQGSNA